MRVPSHEKNIWCYKQKQPLFSEMKKTILHIVFLQVLPENLSDDSFLDSRYPSFNILDDLMSDATNSQDVYKLFVEGSHYTKLSVSYIVQNAFSVVKDSRTLSSLVNIQFYLKTNMTGHICSTNISEHSIEVHVFIHRGNKATIWISVH